MHHPGSLWLRRSAHWESSPSSSWQQGTWSERVGSYSKTGKYIKNKKKCFGKIQNCQILALEAFATQPNPTLNLTPAPNQAQTLIPNGNAVLTYLQTVLLQYLCSPLRFYFVCGICFTTKIFQVADLPKTQSDDCSMVVHRAKQDNAQNLNLSENWEKSHTEHCRFFFFRGQKN